MSHTPQPLAILQAEDEPVDAHLLRTAFTENRMPGHQAELAK